MSDDKQFGSAAGEDEGTRTVTAGETFRPAAELPDENPTEQAIHAYVNPDPNPSYQRLDEGIVACNSGDVNESISSAKLGDNLNERTLISDILTPNVSVAGISDGEDIRKPSTTKSDGEGQIDRCDKEQPSVDRVSVTIDQTGVIQPSRTEVCDVSELAIKHNTESEISCGESSVDETQGKCDSCPEIIIRSGHQDDKEVDSALDDLLEDALDDFNKVPTRPAPGSVSAPTAAATGPLDITQLQSGKSPTPSTKSPASSQTVQSQSTVESSQASSSQSQDAVFNDVFDNLLKQSSPQDVKAMESLLMTLMSGVPNPSSSSSNAAGGDIGGSSGSSASSPPGLADLTETLQQTLGSLASNAQGLQNDEMSEEDLIRMMSSLGGGAGGGDSAEWGGAFPEGGGDDGSFMPLMQGMMKNLLSRDVLYPSLKEISTQYPAWLATNKDKVEDSLYRKYERQYRLMSDIISEFDSERDDDSERVKTERFEKILDVMQHMQELGHPPKEIVGDIPLGLDLDENGLSQMFAGLSNSTNADQCRLM